MVALLHVSGPGPHWLDWGLHLDVLALCLIIGMVYFYAATELRPHLSDAGRVKRRQALLFTAGVIGLYAVTGSPLHELADTYLISAHMLQHVALMLLVAPLLLAGVPGWMWRALLRRPLVMRIARQLTHPLVVLAAVNGILLLMHLPGAIDLQVRQWSFHIFAHAALLGAGLLMWWPILSPINELPRLSYPFQMGYLFLQSLVPSVMASFVTFADRVVYPVYAEAPRIWGLSPLEDQQIGGLLMKIIGSVVLWSFMGVAFFKWYAREEAEARGPRWTDVEEELERLGLTPKG